MPLSSSTPNDSLKIKILYCHSVKNHWTFSRGPKRTDHLPCQHLSSLHKCCVSFSLIKFQKVINVVIVHTLILHVTHHEYVEKKEKRGKPQYIIEMILQNLPCSIRPFKIIFFVNPMRASEKSTQTIKIYTSLFIQICCLYKSVQNRLYIFSHCVFSPRMQANSTCTLDVNHTIYLNGLYPYIRGI